jgi:hypothetical protein
MTLDKKTEILIDFKILEAVRVYKQYEQDLLTLIKKGTNSSEVRKRSVKFRKYIDKFTSEELMQVDEIIKTELTSRQPIYFYN